jgi:hypothetical protein
MVLHDRGMSLKFCKSLRYTWMGFKDTSPLEMIRTASHTKVIHIMGIIRKNLFGKSETRHNKSLKYVKKIGHSLPIGDYASHHVSVAPKQRPGWRRRLKTRSLFSFLHKLNTTRMSSKWKYKLFTYTILGWLSMPTLWVINTLRLLKVCISNYSMHRCEKQHCRSDHWTQSWAISIDFWTSQSHTSPGSFSSSMWTFLNRLPHQKFCNNSSPPSS